VVTGTFDEGYISELQFAGELSHWDLSKHRTSIVVVTYQSTGPAVWL